jgi:TonB family protein
MFRSFTVLALAITIISGDVSSAATQAKQKASEARNLSDREARALALYAPPPLYPLEAREERMIGHGMAILSVDTRTGMVMAARMEPSTGHKILDDAALTAFRQWRFKAGTLSKVRIPVRFTLKGAPGNGIVLVDVDPNTGRVMSVRILQSTGFQTLDEAALKEFRKWRFKPGTASKVRIPITFDMTRIR